MTKMNEQRPTVEAVRVARSIVREWVSKSRLDKEIVETVVSTHQQSLLTISFATALAARDAEIERLKGEQLSIGTRCIHCGGGCADDSNPKVESLTRMNPKGVNGVWLCNRCFVSPASTYTANLQAENQKQRALLVELKMWLAWCGSHARMGIVRGDGVAIQFLQDIAKWSEEKSANPAVVELMKGVGE